MVAPLLLYKGVLSTPFTVALWLLSSVDQWLSLESIEAKPAAVRCCGFAPVASVVRSSRG